MRINIKDFQNIYAYIKKLKLELITIIIINRYNINYIYVLLFK